MTKYHELVISFPSSNGGYTQLCKSENAECLLEAMQRIFEHMGKVPRRILFDNMSSAVTKILPKHERRLADTFSRFTLHHKFEAVFCNPNKGNEKGSVENKVGYKRRNFFVPVPTIIDLEQFNKELLIRCDDDMKREHYRKQELICDLFKEDLKSMLPLLKERFKVTRLIKGKTDNYSFVPIVWQDFFRQADYDDQKQMLNVLTPIILDNKLDEATIAMKIGDISNTDEFLLTYRSLTEPLKPKEIITENTPFQEPYKSDLTVYQ